MPKEDIIGALEHDKVNVKAEKIQVVVKVIVDKGMYAQERDAEFTGVAAHGYGN